MAIMMIGDDLALSRQQYKLMCFLRQGMTIKQAAREMGIKYNTAYKYYDEVKNKMGTFTQQETLKAFSMQYERTRDYIWSLLSTIWTDEEIGVMKKVLNSWGKSGYFMIVFCVILLLSTPCYAQTPVGTPYVTPTPLPNLLSAAMEGNMVNMVESAGAQAIIVCVGIVVAKKALGQVRKWIIGSGFGGY
jgi:DNA-binding CsgD family transcriptional regulator